MLINRKRTQIHNIRNEKGNTTTVIENFLVGWGAALCGLQDLRSLTTGQTWAWGSESTES